jgi:PPK2 family polyphosphate:nucleotide phosphotransferase
MSNGSPTTHDLTEVAARLRVKPGSKVDLSDIDPDSTPAFAGDETAARTELAALGAELETFHDALWAERQRSVLVILQAIDAGGKDGVIRHVMSYFNPQGTNVTSFGVPTEEEAAHDFLWRVHPHAPGAGRLAVWNRSHYEEVLVVRVNELQPASVWRGRYARINAFEETLVERGTTVLKFMLHISRDEQRRRLQDRLTDPAKQWKFNTGDLKAREQWADYEAAYEDALGKCSTADAPWYVIPADHKWYRNLAVARILVSVARELDPKPRGPSEDLSGVVIPE